MAQTFSFQRIKANNLPLNSRTAPRLVHALLRPLRNGHALVRLLPAHEQYTTPVLRRIDVRRPPGHLRRVLQPKHRLTKNSRRLGLITKPCQMSHDRGGGDVTYSPFAPFGRAGCRDSAQSNTVRRGGDIIGSRKVLACCLRRVLIMAPQGAQRARTSASSCGIRDVDD